MSDKVFRPPVIFLTLALLVSFAMVNNALAQWQEPEEWPINRPTMPIRFDWVLLENGELIGGDLISMYRNTLKIDSDEFGVLEIDFDDIRQIRTNDIVSIRLDNNQIYEGQLLLDRTKITFFNKPQLIFPREQLLSITPSKQSEDSIWSGNVSAGLNFKEGNSQRLDYTIQGSLLRLTPLDRLQVSYLGVFARSEDIETDQQVLTEENHRVNFSYDWFYTRKIFFRMPDLELFSDHFKNIDYQATAAVAAGLILIDEDDFFWRIYSGPNLQYTRFVEVEPGTSNRNTSWGILAGTDISYDYTKDLTLLFSYVGKTASEESGSLIHRIEAGIDVELIDDLQLEVKSILDYVAEPSPNELGEVPKSTDILLILGLKYSF
ncbi:DUF481 domain-containing protein [Thalassotalea mangrovi]|uniref:DUF481 domain-containing protein n=1 Tax=Thalassotalea mangrovi TaxID=2572245 RepID=A0A4U1B8D0_9GAMM|nr:DUF481 domain-containing protein [Thalassotalea mangrovi]TKB46932.1 DUF481 domain-containing protein [Thalassotalea mangrovi]